MSPLTRAFLVPLLFMHLGLVLYYSTNGDLGFAWLLFASSVCLCLVWYSTAEEELGKHPQDAKQASGGSPSPWRNLRAVLMSSMVSGLTIGLCLLHQGVLWSTAALVAVLMVLFLAVVMAVFVSKDSSA